MGARAGVMVIVGMLCLVIVVLIGLSVVLRRKGSFSGKAQTATAVITGIRTAPDVTDGGPAYFALVSFTTRTGRPVTTELRLDTFGGAPRLAPNGPPLRAGHQIPIDYDQWNPSRVALNTALIPGRAPVTRPQAVHLAVIGGVVLALIVVGGVAAWLAGQVALG